MKLLIGMLGTAPPAYMSKINLRRLLLAGLVAGIIDNVADGIVSGYLLADDFAALLARLGVTEEMIRPRLWIVAIADMLYGFLLVFTYVAIRPRFGPGPKTAILSAAMLWAVVAISFSFMPLVGLRSLESYVTSALLYLAASIVTSLAGAALYKETRVESANAVAGLAR